MQKNRPPLSHPSRHLIRMIIFLILNGFLIFILHKQIKEAFEHNPGLNFLILSILAIGIILSLRQVLRLFQEIRWVNGLAASTTAEPFTAKPPSLLAPMAAVLSNHVRDQPLSVHLTRSLLDSVGSRLDENREIIRYLAGLLIFLGLLGTFWGLIETVGSVGNIISSLSVGSDSASLFDTLKDALSKPIQGMGLSFSASLFGLASSLIVGFLDLQAGQAQNLFYNELENWLSSATADRHNFSEENPTREITYTLSRIEQLLTVQSTLSNVSKGNNHSPQMRELIDNMKLLTQQIQVEHQLIKSWIDAQAERDKDLRTLINLVIQKGSS